MPVPMLLLGLLQLVIAGGTTGAALASQSRFANFWYWGDARRPSRRLVVAWAANHSVVALYLLAYGLLPITSWPGHRRDGSVSFLLIFFAGLVMFIIPYFFIALMIRRQVLRHPNQ